MLPIKKILCPTDFSEPAYEAIKTAGELAFHFGSELCVLHVVSPVPVVPVAAEPSAFNVSLYEQELEAFSKRSLEEIVNQMEWKELRVRLVALKGNPADAIVRTADEENVDLIVIATRGRTGLDRLIFGSVAEKVIRMAKCPVLTVPTQREKGELSMSTTAEESSEKQSHKKKIYQEKIDAQLKEWRGKIDDLKLKAATSKAELKMKYEEQIKDLRVKQEALEKKLKGLKESRDEAWEDLKEGLENASREMKEALRQAASRFKKGE